MSSQPPGVLVRVRRTRATRAIATSAIALSVVAGGFALTPAAADQTDIDRVAAQVSDLENRAAGAAEHANGARIALEKGKAQLAKAEAEVTAAKKRLTAQREELTRLVRQLYVNGGMEGALLTFTLDDPEQVLANLDQLSTASSSQNNAVQDARAAALSLKAAEEKVRAQQDQLAATANELAEQEQAATDRLAEAQSILARLKEEERARIAAIEEAKRQAQLAAARQAAAELAARRAAEAAAAQRAAEAEQQRAAAAQAQAQAEAQAKAQADVQAQAESGSSSTEGDAAPAGDPQPPAADSGAPSDAGNNNGPTSGDSSLPTPSAPVLGNGGVDSVISYALSQVGKAYVWGAEGPDSFDCSGLTMMAWRQAGVNLDHYSGSQYDQTKHVDLNDLQPGDLLYFYAVSEHVGLYIGNGEFVQASNPSVGVVHSTLDSYWRSNLVAASRPG